ncbi:MAG: TonB-dependent receptor plug domain-containing protein [Alphaproteobacteria bacterium]|nr:TonB-dependent receptor plug domain-containing protein [Alphaproteobacteria bacterium]
MTVRKTLLGTTGAAALIALTVMPEPASAQNLAIEEITVTARRREESLQDTPLSITAFTADSLRQRNVTNIYDLSANTPNFVTTPQLGRRLDRPTIRGQSGTLVRGEPNASYFVDGVFISGSATSSTMDALERVEIIRGPQSALFGRSTFAGAVNFITRQPTNEFEGQFNATVGSHETYKVSGWMSGPIIEDKLKYFFAAGFDTYGGEWRNGLEANEAQIPGFFLPFPPPGRFVPFLLNTPQGADDSKLGGEENTDVTLKLVYDINEDHSLTVKGQYSAGRDDHFPALTVGFDELNCFRPGIDANAGAASTGFFCGELEADDRVSKINIPDIVLGTTTSAFPPFGAASSPSPVGAGQERDNFRFLTEYVGNMNDYELTARFSWNRERFKSGRDIDRSAARPVFGLFTAYEEDETEDWSGEFKISSPADEPLRGLLGVYYFEKRFKERDRRFTGPGRPSIFTSAGGIVCRDDSATFDPVRCDDSQEDVTNYAVFGQIEYDVNDQLNISVEARYAEDEKIARAGVLSPADAATLAPLVGAVDVAEIVNDRLTVTQKTNTFTPRFIVTYKPSEDMTLYGLVAKGDKPIDFNLAFFDDDTAAAELISAVADGRAIIEEESDWNYELGLKSTFMDGRGLFNMSGFYIDWKNQATSSVEDILLGDGTLETNNTVRTAPEARVYGLEIEANFAATENILLTAGYGYADHEFTAPFFDIRDAALDGGDGNVEGNTNSSTPKHNLNLSASYTDDFGNDSDWFVRTFLNYESSKFASVSNLVRTGDRWLWNAQIGVQTADWNLTAYVDNIMDDNTPRTIGRFTDFVNSFAAAPGIQPALFSINPQRGRDFGIRAQYSF